jgi:hypothetical protein
MKSSCETQLEKQCEPVHIDFVSLYLVRYIAKCYHYINGQLFYFLSSKNDLKDLSLL